MKRATYLENNIKVKFIHPTKCTQTDTAYFHNVKSTTKLFLSFKLLILSYNFLFITILQLLN